MLRCFRFLRCRGRCWLWLLGRIFRVLFVLVIRRGSFVCCLCVVLGWFLGVGLIRFRVRYSSLLSWLVLKALLRRVVLLLNLLLLLRLLFGTLVSRLRCPVNSRRFVALVFVGLILLVIGLIMSRRLRAQGLFAWRVTCSCRFGLHVLGQRLLCWVRGLRLRRRWLFLLSCLRFGRW